MKIPWTSLTPALVAVFATTSFVSIVEAAQMGQVCNGDSDCDGNLDCLFVHSKKVCVPVKCATMAAQAVLESGFDIDKYIQDIRSDADLSLDDFKVGSLGGFKNARLEEAMSSTPPPIDLFNAKYTACLNPDLDPDERKLQAAGRTFYGLQWSVSALFSYVGKSTWGRGTTNRLQRLENCIGGTIGADIGLDVLFQIYRPGDGDLVAGDIESSLLFPIVTVGPIGVAISLWTVNDDVDGTGSNIPDCGLATEVSFGASLGVQLGGTSICFTTLR